MNINPDIKLNRILIDFMNNSTIKLLSNGTYGITFEITSSIPFIGISDKPLQKILMKLGIVKDRKISHIFDIKPESIDLTPVNQTEFMHENNIHMEIYTKSKKESQPLCPEIFSYYLLPTNDLKIHDSILNTILVLITKNKKLHKFFRNTNNIDYFGITFMEFLDGYETLFDIKIRHVNKRLNLSTIPTSTQNELLGCENNYLQYVIRTMTGLIELALLGYNHADFHDGNIMFKKSSIGNREYYPDLTDECGRIMIIDFGQTVKIDDTILDRIKEFYRQKEYTDILEEIYNSQRANRLEIYDPRYNFFYKYITGRYSSFYNRNNTRQSSEITQQFNTLIDIVITSREKSKMLYRKNISELNEIKDRYNIVIEELKRTIPCKQTNIISEFSSSAENTFHHKPSNNYSQNKTHKRDQQSRKSKKQSRKSKKNK